MCSKRTRSVSENRFFTFINDTNKFTYGKKKKNKNEKNKNEKNKKTTNQKKSEIYLEKEIDFNLNLLYPIKLKLHVNNNR